MGIHNNRAQEAKHPDSKVSCTKCLFCAGSNSNKRGYLVVAPSPNSVSQLKPISSKLFSINLRHRVHDLHALSVQSQARTTITVEHNTKILSNLA